MSISRRSFLKSSAATAAVSLTPGAVTQVIGKTNTGVQPGPGNKWPGRVVINYNKNAAAGATFDTAVIKTMIDDSIKLLTKKESVGEAWKEIFPSITASSKIAIKVPLGFAAKIVAPHWSSVKAIVDGLLQMDLGGAALPAANITIYENPWTGTDNFKNCGYTSDNIPGVKIVPDSNGTGFTDGAKNLQYAKSLNSATYLINVFRPCGHMAMFEGFTLGFKNHFGTYAIDHTNGAPAYIRDINCTGAVFNKNVLSVCVGLNGAKEVGMPGDSAKSYNYYIQSTFDPSVPDPTGNMPPDVSANTIIMSTDPVSAEMQTIKMMRLNKKPAGNFGIADMPKYLKASGGVSGALSDKTYNIGVIDENAMDIRKIANGVVLNVASRPADTESHESINRFGIAVSHLKGQGAALVEYHLPQSFIGSQAAIEIYDLKGGIVHAEKQRVAGAVNHFAWNEKSTDGKKVPRGMYVVRVNAGALQLSGKLNIAG